MEDLFEVEDRFQLYKTSFLTVGGLLRNCIKFLQPAKSNIPQCLFLGDSRGVLYVTQYKKTEPEILARNGPFSREISCIDLNYANKEKIYFSFGNSIFVTNRLCKDFSKIEFDIADSINDFRVIDNQIWTVSNNYISQYSFGDMTVEKGNFDNESPVLSMCMSEVYGKTSPVSMIGSGDSKIKIVSGKDLVVSIPVSSGPTSIYPYHMSVHDLSENNYLFGTSSGSHGILNLTKSDSKVLWENNINKSLGEVVAMKVHDINYDGVNEIIMIRSDGNVNIYSVGNTVLETSLICKHNTGEILTGVDIGKFRSDDEIEIMLSSFSGLVFSLTPQLTSNSKTKQQVVDKKSLTKNIKEIQSELTALKEHFDKKTLDYQRQQSTIYNPITRNPFKMNFKFTLVPKEAVFHLVIESEFPMEIILMNCNYANLDILDILTKDVTLNIIEDKNKNTFSNSKFICTFKFKEAVHRVEIVMRTYEGISDLITTTIIPFNKPKTAQVFEIPIKALSLHQKFEEADNNENVLSLEDNASVNILTIRGKFSTSELNQIFHLIIPDIPEKIIKDNVKYLLKSSFLNSLVEITIDNNICQVRSVFLSSLIILKEQITKEMSTRQRELEFNMQVKTLSVFKILEKINPMIEEIFNLETKYKMIQAFKELDLNGKGNLMLEFPEEYLQILNQTEEISAKYKQRTINLHYLKILVENLLKDVSKVRTFSNLSDRLKDIQNLFDDYDYEKLVQIFKDIKNI